MSSYTGHPNLQVPPDFPNREEAEAIQRLRVWVQPREYEWETEFGDHGRVVYVGTRPEVGMMAGAARVVSFFVDPVHSRLTPNHFECIDLELFILFRRTRRTPVTWRRTGNREYDGLLCSATHVSWVQTLIEEELVELLWGVDTRGVPLFLEALP